MNHILFIIALNLIVYFPTLRYLYSTDDEEYICRIKDGFFKRMKGIDFIKYRLYGAGTFGLNPEVDHAFTMALQCLICSLIYIAFGSNTISFVAGIMFSLNPINHSTSIWLNGRRYAVNIIIVLLMMIIYPLGWIGKIVSLVLYSSTGLFHMTAIFAPILFGLDNILVCFFLYILFERHINDFIKHRMSMIAESDMKRFTPKQLIIIVKSYGFYFTRMLVPGLCALIYPDLFYWEKTPEGNKNAYSINKDFGKGLLSMCISVFLICFCPNGYRSYSIFMALNILQWCNIIPVLQTLADRYISVASPFMMFFLSLYLSKTGVFYIPLVLLICAYYILSLSVVMPMYRDIVNFYEYHIKNFPKIPVPRLGYIECIMLQTRMKEAEGLVHGGLVANPKDFEMLRFGALFLLFKQNKSAGLALCAEAEKNFYIGQEVEQQKIIDNLRNLLNVIP